MDNTLALAVTLHNENKLDEAEKAYSTILSTDPTHFDALHLLGVLEYQRGHTNKAISLIENALRFGTDIQRNNKHVLNNYITILKALERHSDVVNIYETLLIQEPADIQTLAGYGEALLAVDEFQKALNTFDAILQNSKREDVYVNRGIALVALHQCQHALDSFSEAIKINPLSSGGHWNESLCRLMMGDYETGWRKYQWRWAGTGNKKRSFDQSAWTGNESIMGKTIFIHAEQGLGDTIQFIRYIDNLIELGPKVILGVQPSLKNILLSSYQGCVVISNNESLPHFDYHCSLMDLPYVFRTTIDTIPKKIPYLITPSKTAQWRQKISDIKCPRVGIVWRGSEKNNRHRTVSLEKISVLSRLGVQLVSLKKEMTVAEIEWLDSNGIFHFETELHDFSDTAAIIAQLDMVISIDTSVAHLAGAMGKPAWILLAYNADWRWLCERNDSPWYPTAKLFRQPSMGDWDSALLQVENELVKWLNK